MVISKKLSDDQQAKLGCKAEKKSQFNDRLFLTNYQGRTLFSLGKMKGL